MLSTITVLVSLLTSSLCVDDGTVVKIDSGLIRGHILQSDGGKDYWAFQEVPFAAPPVGSNRYRLPQPPIPWSNVLETQKNTKICYQDVEKDLASEDCLYLNVYTPIKPGSGELLPVLLWIHGGSYVSGSGIYDTYGPKFLIDSGVVIVTINYRLNAFGFLSTEDGVIPPNIGLEDQKFAIKWVNRNIHLFGGDADKVTLVGESAGSMSVGKHLLGPWEDGKQLFRAVIMQSGSPLTASTKSRTNSTVIALELAKKIDPTFTASNTKDLLHFLQTVDAKDIFKYKIPELSIDKHENKVLQHFMDGNYKNVSVLLGFNSEEWLMSQFNLTDSIFEQIDQNPSLIISDNVNISPDNKVIAGALMRDLYLNGSTFVKNRGAFVRHLSDSYIISPVLKQTELCSPTVPYYLYQFAYKGALGNQMYVTPLEGTERVDHAEDLGYFWAMDFNKDISKYSDTDRLTMRRLIKMWSNFAKYLDPTPEDDSLLNNVRWPTTKPGTFPYLNINVTLEVRENPRQYNQFKKILDAYIEPPFSFYM